MTDPRRPEETEEFEAADDALETDEEVEADDLEETQELPRAAAAAPIASRQRGEQATRTVAPVDELPYADDRVSKVWVALIVAVFAAIFLYGLLLGRGGILSTTPTPEPTPSPAPSLSPSPGQSPTARPSLTPGASGSASPGASPSQVPSLTPGSTTVPAPGST